MGPQDSVLRTSNSTVPCSRPDSLSNTVPSRFGVARSRSDRPSGLSYTSLMEHGRLPLDTPRVEKVCSPIPTEPRGVVDLAIDGLARGAMAGGRRTHDRRGRTPCERAWRGFRHGGLDSNNGPNGKRGQ